MKIGIIGFGRLGKLISKYLAQDFSLYIYDKEDHTADINAINATSASLEEVCACPIIIPFVPISSFEECIKNVSKYIKDEALLIDVCSVKEKPVQIMLEHLPEEVQILATHPMFGPDSARESVFGTKVAVCPIRIKDELYDKIIKYMQGNGVKTIEVTPKEHDEQISNSLVLTHLIGRTLIDFKASMLDIDTKGYRRLLKILKTVENDSWQLFEDMNKYNDYAKDTRENFVKCMDNVIGRLKS